MASICGSNARGCMGVSGWTPHHRQPPDTTTTTAHTHCTAPLQTIQQLWAGYGTCKQVTVRNEGDGSTSSYVVKMIRPPEGSGVSHERKVRSYEVEVRGGGAWPSVDGLMFFTGWDV